MQDWAEKGDPPVFWLSGFHIPESLLSALVQASIKSKVFKSHVREHQSVLVIFFREASCRRRGWALDKSTLYTKAKWFASTFFCLHMKDT